MLIILHDFPSFLAYFALGLIEELMDEKFIQLRNVILAAYPKKMKLVEPTTASPNVIIFFYYNFGKLRWKTTMNLNNCLRFIRKSLNRELLKINLMFIFLVFCEFFFQVDILDFLLKRTEMNFKNVC